MNTNETIEIADLEASNADAVKGGNVSNNNRYMGTLTLNQSVLPSTAGPGGNGHIKVIDGTRFG